VHQSSHARKVRQIAGPRPIRLWRTLRFAVALIAIGLCSCPPLKAQQEVPDWVAAVRRLAELHDWATAMQIINEEGARRPGDIEVREWRARVLTWSGNLEQAEKEWSEVLRAASSDPDNWMGLAALYRREGRLDEALRTIDRALELDPKRADLRTERGRILRGQNEARAARSEFQRALELDPGSAEARAGLQSLREDLKNELRIGQDIDLFNFIGTNHDEWLDLVTRWSSRWTTSFGGSFYQRDGQDAGKFAGSVTRTQPHWGALTVGGAIGHDNGVIPRSEAFFDYDRGWRLSEDGWFRGIELTYGPHWYWYASARILTLTGTTIVYLPREWSWSLGLTGARSSFTGTSADWRPSGISRLKFPLARWSSGALSGNVFFAAGAEDFAEIDQIGSFAAQTYGGGLRFQFTPRQDVSAYGFYQKRTQDRTQTSFGLSYGIHF